MSHLRFGAHLWLSRCTQFMVKYELERQQNIGHLDWSSGNVCCGNCALWDRNNKKFNFSTFSCAPDLTLGCKSLSRPQ